MRLNRRSSIILALGLIVIFFAIAQLTAPRHAPPVVTSLEDNQQAPLPSTEPTAQSQFELHNFQRNETRDGKKIWEVIADTGKYFPETGITTLTNAHITSVRSASSTFVVDASKADITLKGTSLGTAHMTGDVKATLDNDLHLETEEALYDHVAQTVTSPREVHILGSFYRSRGDSMFVNTDTQVITLHGNVKTNIEPVQSSKKGKTK